MKMVSQLFAVACLFGAASSIVAAQSALYRVPEAETKKAGYGDVGISFTVKSAITVTELSFFGVSLGGGDTPYVQLWNDDTDTLLGQIIFATGEAKSGVNSKPLAEPVTLKPGVTYQLQSSAYWVPVPEKTAFNYDPVIVSPIFHKTGGWSGWAPPEAPSAGETAECAAVANLTFVSGPARSDSASLGLPIGLVLVAGLALGRRI